MNIYWLFSNYLLSIYTCYYTGQLGDEKRNCYKQVKKERKEEREKERQGRETNFEYVLSTKKRNRQNMFVMKLWTSNLYAQNFLGVLCTTWPGIQQIVTFARCINLYWALLTRSFQRNRSQKQFVSSRPLSSIYLTPASPTVCSFLFLLALSFLFS